MRFSRTVSMKLRYCSASARIGDLGEIDLLAARQVEQQVERAFVAADIDIHHLVIGRRCGLEPLGGWIDHETATTKETRGSWPRGRAFTRTRARESGKSRAGPAPAHRKARRSGGAQPPLTMQSPPLALMLAQMLLGFGERGGRQLDAVPGALLAEIGRLDHQLVAAEQAAEAVVERPERGLRIGLARARRELHIGGGAARI